VTVQPLVQLWGFYTMERNSIPSMEEIQAVLPRVGADRLELDGSAGTAALATGSRLDLGSIAKGYAIDQAIAELRARGVPAALIDLGGNIGVLGQPPSGRPWSVGIKHPREDSLIGLLRFKEGAIATSGDYDRYFEVEGQRVSHLLDPRTGFPAEDLYSVTVIAPNATAADALSTAAFVLGPERGMALFSDCEDVEGLLVQPDSTHRLLIQTTLPTRKGSVSFVLESGTAATLRPTVEGTEPSSRPECVWPLGLEPE
jgi:thiamine biosynthesis lipoprotein